MQPWRLQHLNQAMLAQIVQEVQLVVALQLVFRLPEQFFALDQVVDGAHHFLELQVEFHGEEIVIDGAAGVLDLLVECPDLVVDLGDIFEVFGLYAPRDHRLATTRLLL